MRLEGVYLPGRPSKDAKYSRDLSYVSSDIENLRAGRNEKLEGIENQHRS